VLADPLRLEPNGVVRLDDLSRLLQQTQENS